MSMTADGSSFTAMENGNDKQILAQIKNQVDQFQDNWKDSTGREVSKQMYQAIQEGIKISAKKEAILAMCQKIKARCQAEIDGDCDALPQSRGKTLTRDLLAPEKMEDYHGYYT